VEDGCAESCESTVHRRYEDDVTSGIGGVHKTELCMSELAGNNRHTQGATVPECPGVKNYNK